MKLFRLVCALLLLWQSASAHAPFDCSVRVIVQADSVEVVVTTGATLGENLLRGAQVTPGQLSAGHPFALNSAVATNFFNVSADGKFLPPREADVANDGMEFQFHSEYALAPAKSLRLESLFIDLLNPPRNAPMVFTDENGNLLGSAILSPGKPAAELLLPSRAAKMDPVLTADRTGEMVTNTPPNMVSAPARQPIPAPAFGEFLKLGIFHILNIEAFDHLLFLIALLLGCPRLKTMLLVITGFTVAHSITLALAALNVVTISSRIVEPAIAASIIFVAAENFRREGKSWHRYALTCGFGLIHGFGFASALRASGLGGQGAEIAMPLLAFNLGVEIGQLTVAALVLPLLLALNQRPWFARFGARVISTLIILVAVCWLWQRLA